MATRSRFSRRQFLESAAIGAGAVAVGRHTAMAEQFATRALPDPTHSGIDHVGVVMMENRSFDHILAGRPGADGAEAGITYLDRDGVAHATYPLAPDYQGCAHPDPDHSSDGARVGDDGRAGGGGPRRRGDGR